MNSTCHSSVYKSILPHNMMFKNIMLDKNTRNPHETFDTCQLKKDQWNISYRNKQASITHEEFPRYSCHVRKRRLYGHYSQYHRHQWHHFDQLDCSKFHKVVHHFQLQKPWLCYLLLSPISGQQVIITKLYKTTLL